MNSMDDIRKSREKKAKLGGTLMPTRIEIVDYEAF